MSMRGALIRLGVTGLVVVALLHSPRDGIALNFLHVSGDSDGDHWLDAGDPQSDEYCAFSHADQNADLLVTSADQALIASAYGQSPAVNPLRDQNHDDYVEFLDQLIVADVIFGGPNPSPCTGPTSDPIPPSGVGSTTGPGIALTADSLVSSGQTVAMVSTVGASISPFRGYRIRLFFDETVVQPASGGAVNQVAGFPSCLDNLPGHTANDVPGPEGYVSFGCAAFDSGITSQTALASFTFDVIAPGDPQFRIRTYGPPDASGPAGGTFTIGLDVAPQVLPPAPTATATATATPTSTPTPISGGSSATPTPTMTPPPSGSDLIAHWRFDDGTGFTALDSTVHANHGSLVNGPAWTSGTLGSALQFDGLDDYVEVPDSTSLDIGLNSFTVSAWILRTNATTSTIVSKTLLNATTGYFIGVLFDGRLYFELSGGAFESAQASLQCPPAPGTMWLSRLSDLRSRRSSSTAHHKERGQSPR